MDEQHHIQHIQFEFAVLVCALPDGESFKIQSGYGSMCPWSKKRRLEAYKVIREEVERIIGEMSDA